MSGEERKNFTPEEMSAMDVLKTCPACQTMFASSDQDAVKCANCRKLPADVMCVFNAEAVEEKAGGEHLFMLQSMGVALVAQAGSFNFENGKIYRIIVQEASNAQS